MNNNSVKSAALRDIAKYMREHKEEYRKESAYRYKGLWFKEVWNFRPSNFHNKEHVILNKLLGINKINKLNNVINFKKQQI